MPRSRATRFQACSWSPVPSAPQSQRGSAQPVELGDHEDRGTSFLDGFKSLLDAWSTVDTCRTGPRPRTHSELLTYCLIKSQLWT